MRCNACDKESNNQRVCPFCFTPYPVAGSANRGSRSSTSLRAVPESGNAITQALAPIKATFLKQTPLVRFSVVGIVGVLLFWTFTGGSDDRGIDLTPGSVPSNIIATPMQREEALALIKRTRETALVDMQADEVYVSYPAATFPLLPEGQIALAQQFARADEIVEGKKRRIYFHNPSGKVFAQSDGVTGVTIVQ
ncbi:MAG: hypothetical protein ACKVS7_13425 [Gemmatimonadaceae bacterium]